MEGDLEYRGVPATVEPGERAEKVGALSGGKEVWRRCEGPAADCLRRFGLPGLVRELTEGRFLGS